MSTAIGRGVEHGLKLRQITLRQRKLKPELGSSVAFGSGSSLLSCWVFADQAGSQKAREHECPARWLGNWGQKVAQAILVANEQLPGIVQALDIVEVQPFAHADQAVQVHHALAIGVAEKRLGRRRCCPAGCR